MDYWRLLNELRKSIYCGKEDGCREELDRVLSVASKTGDAALLKGAMLLREEIGSISSKQKILWLTSAVNGVFYPPLDVALAGPVPWDGPHILKVKTVELGSKYPDRTPLKVERGVGLKQCKEIDDCSFVASLIGMKVKAVDHPKVRQISKNLFVVNLHFNGSNDRLVTVDTSVIPTDTEGRQLSMHSDDILDKVIELANLQVTAHYYETGGSNFAVDTFRLTGYLPEILNAKDCDLRQLIKYFRSGLCVIALGTGSTLPDNSQALVSNHDYPVIAVGANSECLIIQDPLDPTIRVEVKEGDLGKYYQQICINWCHSKLFAYKTSLQFFYKAETCNRFDSVVDKPTFILQSKSKRKEPFRILLEKHLGEDNASQNEISYLKRLPDRALFDNSGSPDGATNVGLQLLKLELTPGEKMRLFCHSSKSATFSIHLFSNSQLLSVTREAKPFDVTSVEFEQHFTAVCGSCDYFRNPTISLCVVSPVSEEVTIHLQLLSENSEDLLNVQVYPLSDHTLERPITNDARYEGQKFDLRYLTLASNTPYKVICSTHAKPISTKFRLLATPDSSSNMSQLHIRSKQTYLEFGGFPYHLERSLEWAENTNRKKVHLTSKKNNLCFIRIVPRVSSPLLSIRCNVYDGETHKQICETNNFRRPGTAGIVLDQLVINDCSYIVLLIEKDDPKIEEKVLSSLPFELLIGSQSKLTIED